MHWKVPLPSCAFVASSGMLHCLSSLSKTSAAKRENLRRDPPKARPVCLVQFLKPRFEGIMRHLALAEEEARRALLQTPELLLIEDLGKLRDELSAELERRGLVPEVAEARNASEATGCEERSANSGDDAASRQSLFEGEDRGAEPSGGVSSREESRGESRDVLVEQDGARSLGLLNGESTAEEGGESRVAEGEEASEEAGPSGEGGAQIDVNRIVALFGHRLHAAGVRETLDKTLGLLEAELEIGPADLRTTLAEYPAVLELEPEEILGKIEALRLEGLGAREIRGMVAADPDWLGVDLASAFTPKLEYLKADMGRSVDELLEFPNFLCYR